MIDFSEKIIAKTLRVPMTKSTVVVDNSKVARQLDIALMDVGFKASPALLGYIGTSYDGEAVAKIVIKAIKTLVGEHVNHNVYFKSFPKNVPDTYEFWASLLFKGLFQSDTETRDKILSDLNNGGLNLLNLPGYGQYQHTYEDMLLAQDSFIPALSDRLTIVNLGHSFEYELDNLFTVLASSPIPLNEDDLALLAELAKVCTLNEDANIKVRENLAVINKVRWEKDLPLIFDTLTDILRFAVAFSDGDVTFDTPTKFKSMPRKLRRVIVAHINAIVCEDDNKIGDVVSRIEVWKRLSSNLHPYEFKDKNYAHRLFDVVHGKAHQPSILSTLEALLSADRPVSAAEYLTRAPGILGRNLDRLMREAQNTGEQILITTEFAKVIDGISTKVLISMREHFMNRTTPDAARIFINTKGTSWVKNDIRPVLNPLAVEGVLSVIDAELKRRFANVELVVDSDFAGVAIPTSNKNTSDGFNILPRGSKTPITEDFLRFFCYWKQADYGTDYDLSVLFLNENYVTLGQASYTNLKGSGYTHSGDIVSAPNGASEFIEIDLKTVEAKYIVPQVNIYSGEGFNEVEESFFGYMTHNGNQKGKPFEPKTVRAKSELRGNKRVALPMVFIREDDGTWSAKWMHLFVSGWGWGNATENNRVTSQVLARSIIERDYFTFGDLADLYKDLPVTDVGHKSVLTVDENANYPELIQKLY